MLVEKRSVDQERSTYGVLNREPFMEWGLLPVYKAERLLSKLADEEDGVLSTPLYNLVERCSIAYFHGILRSVVSIGRCEECGSCVYWFYPPATNQCGEPPGGWHPVRWVSC